MDYFLDLIRNPYLITALSSWAIAQVLKVILYAIVNRRLEFERLFGDGGMPSGHSATVSSLATIMGLVCGFPTPEFAIAFILAVVVCHDAMGVRHETGKQAVMLNEIIKILESEDLPEVKLKELVGHTPLQVLAGIILGIAGACLMYFVIL